MHCDESKRDFTFSRKIVGCALAVYIENGLSVKNPVQCLDLSINREEGLNWVNKHGSSVHVAASEPKLIELNYSHQNTLGQSNESNYAFIEKTDFNFIYVECTTEGSSYFDCVFRKIARNGLFAISTNDDPALYGRPPEPALRCYAGLITRTFYAPELAVRLIFAAMARSAARFSKSIEVLLAVAIKSSITIIVKVKKGAESAVKCLRDVRTLVHCSVCEERSFLPDNDGFVVDGVQSYLSCSCAKENVGRTMMALGPVWAGSIGSPSFVTSLLPHLKHSLHLTTFLQNLIAELRCDSKTTKDEINQTKASAENASENNSNRTEVINISNSISANPIKRKAESDECEVKSKLNRCEKVDPTPAPPFYYNLHKHKPKGTQKLLKVEKIIEILHSLGFRASRTHFDRAAVKTNGTLCELQSLISQVTSN